MYVEYGGGTLNAFGNNTTLEMVLPGYNSLLPKKTLEMVKRIQKQHNFKNAILHVRLYTKYQDYMNDNHCMVHYSEKCLSHIWGNVKRIRKQHNSRNG